MKIRITGKKTEKYQIKGLVTPPGLPNIKNLFTVPFGINDKRDQFGNTIQYDSYGRQIKYDATGNPISDSQTKNITTHNKKVNNPFNYDYTTPTTILAGMTGFRSMAQGILGDMTNAQYAKQLGSTDASVLPTPNKTSRGLFDINTGQVGQFTTPVQFAGRPTSEFIGYPSYQPESIYKAQGGALVPERPMSYSEMPMLDFFPKIGNPEMTQPTASAQNIPTPLEANQAVDIDAALMAVAGAESGSKPGKTALGKRTELVGEGGKRASASGTYQITTDTLKQIYNTHFKDQYKNFNQFHNAVKTDEAAEYNAARALMTDNVNKYGIYGIGAWYYPQYAARAAAGDMSVWNKVPRADYGNKLTWGQDFTKKLNLYKQYAKFEEGGEYELDDDQIKDILANGGQVEYL